MAVKAPPEKVPAVVHNRIVVKAFKRADALEQRMVDVLQPILEAAGEKAARAFLANVTDHLTAAGADITSASTMIALKPRPDEAAALTSTDADRLHVTLAYLGETEGDLRVVRDALAPVAARYAPLAGEIAGGGFFGDPGGGGPEILLPDVPGLVEVRVAATEALANGEIAYSRDHGFEAHLTIGYRDDDGERAEYDWPVGAPIHFDAILIVRGDEIIAEIPFVGTPALTAAGTPGWSPPFGDQIVDVDALVGKIRAKTEPVRKAFLQATMTPALKEAGLSFDVTNPLTAKLFAGSAAKVTNIAETTRLNVMRIVRASYDNGLSIPQTATAIRAGMSAASGVRATMIARTELAAAVNGGSLAAASIVGDATGSSYSKRWLTAPGARYPRHETYDGLDGQIAPLDQPFDVGGSPCMFPGDPDGDPGETINCRCVAPWTEISGPLLRGAVRRRFEGHLLGLITASGREMAVSANHPILTRRGWVAADLVEEGDDLICRRGPDRLPGGPDVESVPAEAHERFASLQFAATRAERVSASRVNLHGEIPVGEVEVVMTDDLLSLEPITTFEKHLLKLAFALAEREMGLHRDTATLGGIEEPETVRVARTPGRQGGPADDSPDRATRYAETAAEGEDALAATERANDLGCDSFVATIERGAVAVGEATPRYTVFAEALPDEHRREADLARDLLETFPGLVEADPVVNVVRLPFRGHLFNFSSLTGTYEAEGIIVANCTLAYDEGGEEQIADAENQPDFNVGDSEANATANAPIGGAFDDVSVGGGEPVPGDVIAKIKANGLDLPLEDLKPTTDVGREVYAGAKNTESMYKVGGTWAPERAVRHDEILKAHFAGKDVIPAADERQAFFTAGGGASGKSRAIFDVGGEDHGLYRPRDRFGADLAPEHPHGWYIEERPDTIVIDPDRIKAMLPEYERLKKANDLYAASGVHEESSEIAKRITAEAYRRGYNVVLDSTGSSSKFLSRIEEAKALGYETHVTMFSIPTNTAIVRSMERGARSGRYVSMTALKDAHKGASSNFAVWKNSKVIDDWRLYDGEPKVPTLVAEGGKGTAPVRWDEEKLKEILAKATEGPHPVAAPPPSTASTLERLMPGPSPEAVTALANSRAADFEAFALSAARPGIENGKVYREKLDAKIAAAVKAAPLRVRVDPKSLVSILGDGRFKSQIETGTSRGLLAPGYRAATEKKMFGYDANLDPTLRPIYGYLGGSTNEAYGGSVRNFGEHVVVLKDSVRDRSTFALTDSLGPGAEGRMIPQPLVGSKMPSLALDLAGVRDPLAKDSLHDLSDYYAEIQVHGGLDVNAIAEVIFDANSLETATTQAESAISYLTETLTDLKDAVAGVNLVPADARAKRILEIEKNLEAEKARLAAVENGGALLKERLDTLGIPYRTFSSFDTPEALSLLDGQRR